MCLYKGSNKMQIASEDIVCYKIIEIYHLPGGDDYRSYFQRTKIELNEPILPGWEVTVQNLNETNHLYGEVVHAYMSPYITKEHIDRLKECTTWCSYTRSKAIDIALVMCTIPKGTLYCTGHDDHLLGNYGALTIIPNKIIRVLTTVYR